MSRSHIVPAALAVAVALAAAQAAGAPGEPKHGTSDAKDKPAANDQQLIASAMQAAPARVASGAAIVDPQADGSMRTVREGDNGFTCMADNPETPGPDPMCMDAAAAEWAGAWMAHKTPASGKVGLMYMLAGGTDASNTDPYATAPSASNHWIKTGPHVMVVGADATFYDMYPKGADPDTAAPYVMWPGTPYQHLMIPIK